jgi:hypothetical protein
MGSNSSAALQQALEKNAAFGMGGCLMLLNWIYHLEKVNLI